MSSLSGPEVGGGPEEFDVVVAGAGMAGLYLLYRLRALGFSARVVEAADDVGGTWYWNRYPGARCDIQSVDYSYSFDPDLDAEWRWTEKYASQPEILRYLQHVADRHDLRRDIEFRSRVVSAEWEGGSSRWQLRTSGGRTLTCRYYVMATGCLSMPKEVDIDGADRFAGPVYFTSRWPHAGVDFTGQRVAVIGTGSSAIQSIPLMAAEAATLTVFQRTPNFSIPAHNGPVPADKLAALEGDRPSYRRAARWSPGGVPNEPAVLSALAVSEEERLARYEETWERGGILEFLGSYNDHLANPVANELLAEFVRGKIRAVVRDPETAELLCPRDYPIGTKRLCVDTGYYETFNRPNVRLVDLRTHPIATVTPTGVDLVDESLEFDALVFATGFDAMTGALVSVDITGRDGLTLRQAWADGPRTYLGLMAPGFPNLFMVTGPGSPSVLSNMAVSIEQHVEWITDCLAALRDDRLDTIEPTGPAADGWVRHGNDFADLTLVKLANSWYMGANVPGKPRVFLPYVGGVDRYRRVCDEVVAADYLGFRREGDGRVRCHDGVVRRLQPDVMIMLELLAGLELPSLETLPPAEARAFSTALAAQRPPGPEVGEIVDGTLPGAGGELAYRLLRPASPGPHPVIVYFHGGGWVLGGVDSDEPFCRDLCVRCGAVVITVDYRHAPEARFPSAADDAVAATRWIADHAAELGARADQLVVAGWSAGANLAAVVTQVARDTGGPPIAAQLLVNPVTDSDLSRPSYAEHGDGYVLTTAMMDWFWACYADPIDRTDPRAAPLRAASLAGLPPAVVVTSEFDPLRDEGLAYAAALAAAGVPVHPIDGRGQIHTSLVAVDVLPSGGAVRGEIAAALVQLLAAPVPA